jgi:hypothetical protein
MTTFCLAIPVTAKSKGAVKRFDGSYVIYATGTVHSLLTGTRRAQFLLHLDLENHSMLAVTHAGSGKRVAVWSMLSKYVIGLSPADQFTAVIDLCKEQRGVEFLNRIEQEELANPSNSEMFLDKIPTEAKSIIGPTLKNAIRKA